MPRAELWGAIQVLSRVDETTDIQIPIDAKYVGAGIRAKWRSVADPFPWEARY